jgi:hypothetical protein
MNIDIFETDNNYEKYLLSLGDLYFCSCMCSMERVEKRLSLILQMNKQFFIESIYDVDFNLFRCNFDGFSEYFYYFLLIYNGIPNPHSGTTRKYIFETPNGLIKYWFNRKNTPNDVFEPLYRHAIQYIREEDSIEICTKWKRKVEEIIGVVLPANYDINVEGAERISRQYEKEIKEHEEKMKRENEKKKKALYEQEVKKEKVEWERAYRNGIRLLQPKDLLTTILSDKIRKIPYYKDEILSINIIDSEIRNLLEQIIERLSDGKLKQKISKLLIGNKIRI